jgi:hypothetical protein
MRIVLWTLLMLTQISLADVEYVSATKQQELQTLFNQAHFHLDTDSALLRKRDWVCDMYGVRTRMQVQHGLKLYRWSSDNWQNLGSQVTQNYQIQPSALVGQNQRFVDQVKMSSDGRLIAQLSTQPASGNIVIAYSVCK